VRSKGEGESRMRDHFLQLAEYNRWANHRIYTAAGEFTEEMRHRDVGAYFKSLHGTLAHILVADQLWLARLHLDPPPFASLDAQPWADFAALSQAREVQDARSHDFISGLSAANIDAEFDYRDTSGTARKLPRRIILTHVFNHATHHRGQAHHILKQLGMDEPPALDLPYFVLGLD
jgi:uncharacterized damage-inducible protein DinB